MSHNTINGVNEEKEGRNGRERMNRGREWTNRKERGRFGDGWDYFFVSSNSILIILINRIFRNFDRLKKTRSECRLNMSACQNKHHKKIYSITKGNSAKLGITISEEVTGIIFL